MHKFPSFLSIGTGVPQQIIFPQDFESLSFLIVVKVIFASDS